MVCGLWEIDSTINKDDLDFDFGFTAVTEDEVETVQKTKTTATDAQARLEKLYNAITPLLTNLKKNPEKEYILWPNRLKKVEEFEDYIQKIYLN